MKFCLFAAFLFCACSETTTGNLDGGPKEIDSSADGDLSAGDLHADHLADDLHADHLAVDDLAADTATDTLPDQQGMCEEGLSECNGVCVNLMVDIDNCGVCDRKCDVKANASCNGLGECKCRKPYGDPTIRTWCDGDCPDLLNDDQHCGACGNECKPGSSCEDGACSVCGDGVATGTEECDGNDLRGRGCLGGSGTGNVASCTSCTLDISACTCTHPIVTKSCADGWCKVPAGCFLMGSSPNEPCRSNNETQHTVTLTHGFEIAATEVTQAQFKALLGYETMGFTPGCDDCPAATWWHGAAAYCNQLSKDSGLPPCYVCANEKKPGANCYAKATYNCPGYRLPTEAEWEYAYRAGTTTAYYNGVNDAAQCKGTDSNAELIGWNDSNAGQKMPVMGKQPNAWGLYDMAGNVWEWTHNSYTEDLGTWPMIDPHGGGKDRVIRGGAFTVGPDNMRAAFRTSAQTSLSSSWIGFRCLRLF